VGTSVALHQRTALLYLRLDESVHVEVADDSGRPHLVISGPANRRRARDFCDEASLNRFLDGLQRTLERRGFQLIARAERRQPGDSRQARRSGQDRRRT